MVLTKPLKEDVRLGFSGLHAGRLQPFANDLSNIPAQFGVQGIPQISEKGGLPNFGIGTLTNLGSASFLVSDEFNSTTQITENLTRVYKLHMFKRGFEFQHIKFSTLQPAWSRGQFNYDGNYRSIPTQANGSTGRGQFLLIPTSATVPNGINNVGGADNAFASNIANTDDGRNYYGAYFQDDWKATPKLTLNLGLRWDFFGQVEENYGAQGNIFPGAPFAGARYLIPIERQKDPLSTSFLNTLAKDGIVRGGYRISYGGFENRVYGPNLGENYPFVFNFTLFAPDDAHPITYTTPSGSTYGIATFETGFSRIPLTPLAVNASGLSFNGIQYNYITPYTPDLNFMVQYQLTPNTSFEVGYVGAMGRHLETFSGPITCTKSLCPQRIPRILRRSLISRVIGPSATTNANTHYHALQTKLERRFSNGLDFLWNYTYSKGRGNALDLLNGGRLVQGFRAPDLPGFGIQKDFGLTSNDIRNIMHYSRGYELPLGAGKSFPVSATGALNQVVGRWSVNWILTLQDGQPVNIPCTVTTAAGLGCMVPGQSVIGVACTTD